MLSGHDQDWWRSPLVIRMAAEAARSASVSAEPSWAVDARAGRDGGDRRRAGYGNVNRETKSQMTLLALMS